MPEARRTAADIRTDVLNRLAQQVSRPELRAAVGDVLLRDCGLDSFGTFEFIVGLEQELGLAIPDDLLDARRCRSVNGIVEILVAAGEVDRAGEG